MGLALEVAESRVSTSACTSRTRLRWRRLRVPLHDNRARWAGPRAKGNRGAHARPPGGTTESLAGGGARRAEPRRRTPWKGGVRAEWARLGGRGSQEQSSPAGPDPEDPVRKEKNLGGALEEGDE